MPTTLARTGRSNTLATPELLFSNPTDEDAQMTKSRFPNALVLIFTMILLAQIATYLLPAGEYDRVEIGGHERVVPGSYREIDTEQPTVRSFLFSLPKGVSSIPKGMAAGADIIFFVFIVGGVIGVIRATGAIDAMIASSIRLLGNQPVYLVGGMVTLFALGSASVGMAEEYMPFIPILVTMCLAMKMDAVVALAIVYIGAGVGYGCALMNPFTVLIAQKIAEVPAMSGWPVRAALLVVCLAIGIHHIMRYARRIHADPTASLVHDVDYSQGFEMPQDTKLTPARCAILIVFVLGILGFVVGASLLEWYLVELSTIFIGLAVASAVIARMSPNLVAEKFCGGAAELTTTALLIGFARTIQVVLEDGQVSDTVIHAIAQPLQQTGPYVTAIGMLAVQSVCNFFIPSGSGQAYVTMPIMAPLADITNVSRQTAVLAYQLGDGFTNMIVPTNALLMGMLVMAKIPFQRWVRFIVPLLLKLYIVAMIALVLAVLFKF